MPLAHTTNYCRTSQKSQISTTTLLRERFERDFEKNFEESFEEDFEKMLIFQAGFQADLESIRDIKNINQYIIFEIFGYKKLCIVLKYYIYKYESYGYSVLLLLSIFYCIKGMLVISYINEGHESNKIENKDIRV